MSADVERRPLREARIDLDAVRGNVRALRAAVQPAHIMVVVKADAYGHGAVEAARAAVEAGADWLGVADLREGLALRTHGIQAPVLAWLHGPDADFPAAVAAGIDLGISSLAQLERAAQAASTESAAGPVAVQLKLDTGLGRNGLTPDDCVDVFARAAELEAAGRVRVRGLFSHLSNTSPEHDREQLARFDELVQQARTAGLDPELRHLAASAATIALPETRLDLVRVGIAAYGLSPDPQIDVTPLGLRPAMELSAEVVSVKRVPAGHGVSYGLTYRTPRETTLALVPLGYADGVPRAASDRGPVQIGAERFRVAGRIAMDQFVVDVGDAPVRVGDRAVLWGDPATGAPSADDWADAAGTINYEIVTRVGGRVERTAPPRLEAEPVPPVEPPPPVEPVETPPASAIHLTVPDADAMESLGARLAALLTAGDLVLLNGELGAGKTTLTRGLGAALQVRGTITSPTFVLARTHPTASGTPLVHVDAYRLATAVELDDLDIDWAASIGVVEWGEGKVDGVADSWISVDIVRPLGGDPEAEDTPRSVTLTGHGPRWADLADRI